MSFIVCSPFCRYIRRIVSGVVLVAAVGTNANTLISFVVRIEFHKAERVVRRIAAIVPVDVDTWICIGGIPYSPKIGAVRQRNRQHRVTLGEIGICRIARPTKGKSFLCNFLGAEKPEPDPNQFCLQGGKYLIYLLHCVGVGASPGKVAEQLIQVQDLIDPGFRKTLEFLPFAFFGMTHVRPSFAAAFAGGCRQ